MLLFRLLKLMRVGNDTVLMSDLALSIQVHWGRASPLASHLELLLPSRALTKHLVNCEFTRHEGLFEERESLLFAAETSLLLSLLLCDLPLDLPLGHFFRRRD